MEHIPGFHRETIIIDSLDSEAAKDAHKRIMDIVREATAPYVVGREAENEERLKDLFDSIWELGQNCGVQAYGLVIHALLKSMSKLNPHMIVGDLNRETDPIPGHISLN
jgi:hypothetical protein